MPKKNQVEILEVDDAGPKVLAAAIVQISTGMRTLLDGPLTEDAIITLIQASLPRPTKMNPQPGKRDIKRVLQAVRDLDKNWVKPGHR